MPRKPESLVGFRGTAFERVAGRRSRARTGSTVVPAIHPNAGVTAWYAAQLDDALQSAYIDAALELTLAYRDRPLLFVAGDSASPLQNARGLRAAGVMFRAPDGDILLCNRVDGEGWAFPAGSIEVGETAEECAQRETREEVGRVPEALSIVDSGMNFATFVSRTRIKFTPQLNSEHTGYIWIQPRQALATLKLHPGVYQTLAHTEQMICDAAFSVKYIDDVLRRWGKKWHKRFDKSAADIAKRFTSRSFRMTETAMKTAFKQSGFTVSFNTTRNSLQAYKLTVAENVGLIRNLQQDFYNRIQQDVWASVRAGADMAALSEKLQNSYALTKRRADLISRDQNAKAKAVIETTRRQELGITKAIWQHSSAGKEPRPVHAKWGREQQVFDLSKGMYDPDEGEYVFPGQLINCRCTSRAVIEGFESDT